MRHLLPLALLAAGVSAGTANAQSFSATLGYHNTEPKSGNGSLAGAAADVDADWGVTGSAAYHIDDSWSVELWSGLHKFGHQVSLDGLGTVAGVEHRPTSLSVNYHFLPERRIRPFVGIGYGQVSVSGEQGLGALSGLGVSASSDNGVVAQLGVDFAVNDWLFLRADARQFQFDTDVVVETLGAVGTANVDPLIFGISVGARF
ncbi:MAG TPA: OmpW family outer membrane protein [Arenimonas sp.]|nr:OmpW family outer membrane protein [Arenimonas sp.]